MDDSRRRGAEPPRRPAPAIEAPHAAAPDAVLAALKVDPRRGLDSAEAARRLARFGPNDIAAARRRSALRILLDQFSGAIFQLLAAGALLSLWMGDRIEAAAIVAVLLVNGLIGFAMESRAQKSMEALRGMARTRAHVRRDGVMRTIDAADVVPGDVAELRTGDVAPADIRVIEAVDLHADESALTGESVPVAKSPDPVAADAPLAERASMIHRGTSITRGFALGVVTATGADAALGRIAALVAETRDEATPLERRLETLGRQLARAAIALVAGLTAVGALTGREPLEMARTAIALAVAAAPEGLPIVATLALARGMRRMAAQNALVNRLASIETLGSTTTILTDKTGTLTENRMTVAAFLLPDREAPVTPGGAEAPDLREAARVAALANEPNRRAAAPARGGADGADGVDGAGGAGGAEAAPEPAAERFDDPMERALVEAAGALGLTRAALLAEAPQIAIRPFDPELKMMATIHRGPEGIFAAVKGAPEALLARAVSVAGADGDRPMTAAEAERLRAAIDAAAAQGLRLLGLARARLTDAEDDPFSNLTLLGFACLRDPPRPEVAPAIAECRAAGVRVAMATGDHPATARRIALEVGIVDDPEAPVAVPVEGEPLDPSVTIHARVAPHLKLDLVRARQQAGEIVAMIGDGVNDAPALKQADIGVAMGRRGTQVAAEASDIILRDDDFRSIVAAIRQGRVIYDNIRTFVRYLFSCNLGEVMLVGAALLAGLPMPLTPLQILFLNLVTDVFPALALGAGEGARDVMRRPPRPPDEPLLGRSGWLGIGLDAAGMAGCTLAAFVYALHWRDAAGPGGAGIEPHAAAFLTLALAQLWHVFLMRAPDEPALRNQITRNRWVWAALALSLALVVAGTAAPGLSEVLRLQAPSPAGWALVFGASAASLAVNAAVRRIVLRARRRG